MYEFVIGKYTSKYRDVISNSDSNHHWAGANHIFSFLWENYKEMQLAGKMADNHQLIYL